MFKWAFKHAGSTGGASGNHYTPSRYYSMPKNKYKNGLRQIRGNPVFAYQRRQK